MGQGCLVPYSDQQALLGHFLREPDVGIEKEIKVTERSRNQKTHGEKTVGRSHESVETEKLRSKKGHLGETRRV